MIKITIKTLSVIFFFLILVIFYLSFFGIKTDKFNNKIANKILKINKKIDLDLDNVSFLLNPFDLTINIIAKNPIIKLNEKKLEINNIKTNISLKALLSNKFLIDDLQISTKANNLNSIISLIRLFKSSTKFFLLDSFTKNGSLTANLKINFDNKGNLKDNYEITGFIENGEFNVLNKFIIKNLNLNFEISKNKYLLTRIKTDLNDVLLSSPLIEVNESKDLFAVKGNITTNKEEFDTKQLGILLNNLLKDFDVKKIKFSSVNNFSFDLSKKLKLNNLKIKSEVILHQLNIKSDLLSLKSYLPDLNNSIKFENHKIKINYSKKMLDINGNGEVLINENSDSLNYKVVKKNNQFFFDTKINLKNKKLFINFLDFEKKKSLDSSLSIKGNFKKNNKIQFDLISLKGKNNNISVKNLNLNKEFKILSIDNLKIDHLNNKGFKNQFILKKDKSNYTIVGDSFYASKLINNIMDGSDKDSSIFDNFNSRVNLKIKKTYIDEINFINDLSGFLFFKNNKIIDAKLDSTFPNKKKINLLISTNDINQKITRLSTENPKPLIKRYKFIKGFEGGYLNYYSIKNDETLSNSLLVIDNFKVKDVPVFAKLLSLASLQGIGDLLTGEGIRFSNFEMKFSNQKGLTTIEELYAIGPAVSILMEGYIESKKLISLRGTLVPATTINRTISSIPVLGQILVGQKTGEGVFGVSFKIKGPPKKLSTTVNPIKTLTPRFITRTLEKIKKN